jgi:hypothetical protein
MRRTAIRVLVLGGLCAVGAGVLLVALGQGSGDSGGGSGGAAQPRDAAAGPPPARPVRVPPREVETGPDWAPHPGPVPILRFHVVGEAALEDASPELFVPPEDFRAQLDWLEEHGYEAVGLETVEGAWFEGRTLPPKPIVLSFDGVAEELMSVALPELRRRGWPGVLVFDTEARAPDPAKVRRLLTAGWGLEPQARRPDLTRRALEAEFRVPVRNFAFPPGEGDGAGERRTLEGAGYSGATVTGGGFAEASRRWAMPRITIYGLSGVEGFAEAIRSRGEGVGA